MAGDASRRARRREGGGAGRRRRRRDGRQAAGRDGRRRRSRSSRPSGSPTRAIGPFAHDRARRRPQPDVLVLQHEQAQRGRRLPHDPTAAPSSAACSPAPTSSSRRWRRRSCDALGIDLEAPPGRAPADLVVVSITPFGLDGPWADRLSSDLVGLALGNPLNSCGYDDHSIPPIRPGGDQGYQSAASFALIGLHARADRAPARPAGARLVDVGMHDCLAVNAELVEPVLVLPEGARAPADLPPRAADADATGHSSSAATTGGCTS